VNARRPLVGIVAYEGRWPSPTRERPSVALPAEYVQAIADGGALPVVVPVGLPIDELAERLDGVVLAGGPDVDPARYGAEAGERTSAPEPRRDATEIDLIGAAGRLGLPLLAICRGVQVLNVARGGTLLQHLPDVVGHEGHAPSSGRFGRHEVTAVAGSALAGILGCAPFVVESAHHQAIDRLGGGLVVVATAPDGTVEAVEDPEEPFVLGVQWHPEAGSDRRLFAALASAAADREPARGARSRRSG